MAEIIKVDVSDSSATSNKILESAICAIGVFDGVHLGHQFLINQAIAAAISKDCCAVIITFDIDPDEIFNGSNLKKIMTNEYRISKLAEFDVAAVVVLHFNKTFAAMSPDDFLDYIFNNAIPNGIFVGEDFRFGYRAEGDFSSLSKWASRQEGVLPSVIGVSLKEQDGEPITSTRIRKLLHSGSLDEALTLLGHPYIISGTITHGRGQGAEFGICTADLQIPEIYMIAKDGVYASYAYVIEDSSLKVYLAAVSIGIPPTFKETAKANVEAHLLDFEGDLYGKTLIIDVRHYLRPMLKFCNTDELINSIKEDIKTTRELL